MITNEISKRTMPGNQARHATLIDMPRSRVPTDDLYARFQNHERFCEESLMVETESGTLVPMRLSPGQFDCGRRSASSASADNPCASST